eukprot:8172504-Ditylum_brightwellii.AAC.1
MMAKLESKKQFSNIDSKVDAVLLLQLIKTVSYKYHFQCYSYPAIYQLPHLFYLTQQKWDMTDGNYLQDLNNKINVLEECKGIIRVHRELMKFELEQKSIKLDAILKDQTKNMQESSKEAFIAYTFLARGNKMQYVNIARALCNDF